MALISLNVIIDINLINLASLNFNTRTAGNKTTAVFIKFLRDQLKNGSLKALKKDEWSNIIEFLESHYNSIAKYDEMEAWPTIFDSFVNWVKE